jgi:Cof subfamily protein (haloacid dehalogenase superfamily)
MSPTSPDFSHIQAILFDYDQTLTNPKREVTERTRAAVVALQPYVKTALCTGRDFQVVSESDRALFLPDAVHVLNGGAEVGTNTGEMLWTQAIPDAVVRQLLEVAERHQCSFLIKNSRELLGNSVAQERYKAGNSHRFQQALPLDLTKQLDSLSLVITQMKPEAWPDFRALSYLATYKEMTNYEGEHYLEVTALGVTKAAGLQKWSELTGIPVQNVIGVGDSPNDLEFLQAVGFGIAMGNAVPELIAIADSVIGSNDEDGLAVFLEELLPELKERTS